MISPAFPQNLPVQRRAQTPVPSSPSNNLSEITKLKKQGMVHHKKSHSNFLNSNQSQHMNSLKTFINGAITPSELFANHPYSAQHHSINIQAPPFIGNQSISSSVQLLKQ